MKLVDTNILIYAVLGPYSGDPKAERAVELLRAPDLAFSAQVFAEFYTQATRQTRPYRLPEAEALAFLVDCALWPVQPVTGGIVHAAIQLCRRHSLSYWDAAIIEAARAAGCDTVLSEDMTDGADYDGVRVVDPFKDAAA